MRTEIHSSHFTSDGKPDGGQTYGQGFCIAWQRGALVKGEEKVPANGAFVEDVIAAAADRIKHYQDGQFWCQENQSALEYLERALECLFSRTKRREAAGTLGSHKDN